jgi:dihydroorotase
MQYILRKVTVVCPTSPHDGKKKDILIRNGIIEKIANSIEVKNATLIEVSSLYVSVGWIDLFANFCDPGEEYKEDLQSGAKVAASGGFTDVCLIPNTNPIIDSKTNVEYIKQLKGIVNLHPIGAVSKKCDGKDLAEMYDMKANGAVSFSDGTQSIQSGGLLLKALQYVKNFNGVIIQVPNDQSISKNGLMNEGVQSTKLGMQGEPDIAESLQIARDIELSKYTNSHIHFTGVSCKKSIDIIRQAKKQGLKISCSVTPYHLLYTDSTLHDYNSIFKVNPPLRTELDRKALIKALEDGTIDCIASHHMPQDWDAKQCEFEYAKAGMISLQTILPMLLKVSDKISIEQWITMLTTAPRKILNIANPQIAENEKACLTVFSINESWTYNDSSNKSKSNNSPVWGETLIGKIIAVFNNSLCNIYE